MVSDNDLFKPAAAAAKPKTSLRMGLGQPKRVGTLVPFQPCVAWHNGYESSQSRGPTTVVSTPFKAAVASYGHALPPHDNHRALMICMELLHVVPWHACMQVACMLVPQTSKYVCLLVHVACLISIDLSTGSVVPAVSITSAMA
jgi:hypothetical protein